MGSAGVSDEMRVQVSAQSLAEDAVEPDLIAGNIASDGADEGQETYYWTRRQMRRSLAFLRDLYGTMTR